MKGKYKRRDSSGFEGLSPLSGETAAGLAEPDTPFPAFTVQDDRRSKEGGRQDMYDSDKIYVGVRVKMPVRDLLRNQRLAQGWEPQEIQETFGKTVKGEKKRVKTRTGHRTTGVGVVKHRSQLPQKKKHPTKSQEELAIIVEVLEEDLRTSKTSLHSPSQTLSCHPPVSPALSPAGYNSDESDEMIPSPQSYITYPQGAKEYHQALSPLGFFHTSRQPSSVAGGKGDSGGEEEWSDPQNCDWNRSSSAFFWAQLQKEENQLRNISDGALLDTDDHGRTAFHKVACVGKRALGYAIAKRMAVLNSLDLKDSDGMTALLHAANHNHHLMVADLISLGANINETNNSRKSCLHLSAEKGYIRVLEVLKHAMMGGVFVDVEAPDNHGMSVLQCASVALKATVCELENSRSPSHTRLHTLRQEQMMETLECLLHMGSYPLTMTRHPGGWSMQPRTS